MASNLARLFWPPLLDPFYWVPVAGLPFASLLLLTVAGYLLLGTEGLPFESPLCVTVAGQLRFGISGLLFVSHLFGDRCQTPSIG